MSVYVFLCVGLCICASAVSLTTNKRPFVPPVAKSAGFLERRQVVIWRSLLMPEDLDPSGFEPSMVNGFAQVQGWKKMQDD